VNLKAEVPSQRTSPRIIHDHDRAKWGSLHDSLDLPAVPHSTPNSLDEQKLNGAFIIVVATFQKGVAIKEGSQPVLRSPAFEEILPDRFGNQNSREEKLSFGRRSRWSSAITHELSIVQRRSRIPVNFDLQEREEATRARACLRPTTHFWQSAGLRSP
jgi:hypothetical protein